MTRIFIGIFVASFMIHSGIESIRVLFNDIQSIFLWKNITLNDTMFYWLIAKDFNDMSMPRLDEILIEVDTLSEKYVEFMDNLRLKQDERWKYKIDRRYPTEFYSSIKLQLSVLINTVDYMHKEALNFKVEGQSVDEIMQASAQFLSKYLDKLLSTLDQIYKLIFPSFTHITPKFFQLNLVNAERNVPFECDQYTSAQQFVYFTYITLIITEMKGFSALIFISLKLQRVTESNESITVIEIGEKKFTKRVEDYYKNIYKNMVLIPREIHRCEVNPPKRGENFLELVNYHQVKLLNAGSLGINSNHDELYCNYKCEHINHTVMEKMMDVQIHDCRTVGMVQNIQSCRAESGSSREYLWWKNSQTTFGHYEICPTALHVGNGDIPYSQRCFLCQCSVIPESNRLHKNAILNISVTPQLSDIKNNMIVSGVRFVIHENVLHLQIQQSKFIHNTINDNSTVWKSLHDNRTNLKESKIRSEKLSKFKGQLYLDDVILPPKYAVTGVRFMGRTTYPEGIYLQIHGTPINLVTGKLTSEDYTWFIANPDFAINTDYEQKRVEIKTYFLDDPTRCREYNYDRTTNKYITFRHSSVSKDGGQSTVPFIDAQPVDTYPPFPLSGIGLFYRTKPECGGYITPRLFTIDISQYN